MLRSFHWWLDALTWPGSCNAMPASLGPSPASHFVERQELIMPCADLPGVMLSVYSTLQSLTGPKGPVGGAACVLRCWLLPCPTHADM